jgi:rubrerythrin
LGHSTLSRITASRRGIAFLLAHTVETERDAVALLDSIIPDLLDERLRKIATKHRDDEQRHVDMLRALLPVDAPPVIKSRTIECYGAMAPQTVAQKYATILVAEERAARNYPSIAQSLEDARAPREAACFRRMAKDEAHHMRFCRVVLGTLNETGMEETLARYREIARMLEDPCEPQLYNHADHFEMISRWGEPLDAEALGAGLIIPNLCVGFVDGIGHTKTAFFYGLRANPQFPMVTRGKAILRLADSVLRAARAAGYTRGVTTTANTVVERYWVERLGFRKSSEILIQGDL